MPSQLIQFTRPLMEAFEKKLNQAIKDGEEKFYFENHLFLVSYAKYLLIHLKSKFHN